jgi:hypothetical protein
MKKTRTYFEQVPKAVIVKIIAQQNVPAEGEFGETGAAAKPSAIDTKIPTRPHPKGEPRQQKAPAAVERQDLH